MHVHTFVSSFPFCFLLVVLSFYYLFFNCFNFIVVHIHWLSPASSIFWRSHFFFLFFFKLSSSSTSIDPLWLCPASSISYHLLDASSCVFYIFKYSFLVSFFVFSHSTTSAPSGKVHTVSPLSSFA